MATEKQTEAVQEMVRNGGYVIKAMRTVGYSENTVKTPSKLTKSIGFQELCEKHGLTDKLIIDSLTDDIKAKPQNRVAELTLAARIKGKLIDRSENKNINLNFSLSDLHKELEKEEKDE